MGSRGELPMESWARRASASSRPPHCPGWRARGEECGVTPGARGEVWGVTPGVRAADVE